MNRREKRENQAREYEHLRGIMIRASENIRRGCDPHFASHVRLKMWNQKTSFKDRARALAWCAFRLMQYDLKFALPPEVASDVDWLIKRYYK